MPYKINNIHSVDELIRKIRPTLAPSKLRKLSDRGKSKGAGLVDDKNKDERKENFQQALKKAIVNRRRSWRA